MESNYIKTNQTGILGAAQMPYALILSARNDVEALCFRAVGDALPPVCVNLMETLIPYLQAPPANAVFLIDCTAIPPRSFHFFLSKIHDILGQAIFLAPHGSPKEVIFTLQKYGASVIPFPCSIKDLREHLLMRHIRTEPQTGAELKDACLNEFAGTSHAAQQVRMQIARLAESKISVLILGETGTGKGLVASLIHNMSLRKTKRLLHVNAATLHDTLADSELFGTTRGAFTGAIEKCGYYAEADHSSLFIDEIASLSLSVQAKLLCVLDNGHFSKLGSTKELCADVRLLSAANEDLQECIAHRRFRADLYYRISDAIIRIPPLRERREDIPAIAAAYLKRIGFIRKTIDSLAMDVLVNRDWPGNVRQLEKCLYVACQLSKGRNSIHAEDLSF